MNVRVECIPMADHLVVRVAGEWTDETARHIIDRALEAASAHGLDRIFLDTLGLGRPARDFTRYLSGKYVAETLGPRFRVAALGKPDNVTHYAETVALNRGSPLMAFTDEESAMRWLMQ
jgi:hypothetical protein